MLFISFTANLFLKIVPLELDFYLIFFKEFRVFSFLFLLLIFVDFLVTFLRGMIIELGSELLVDEGYWQA